MTPATFEAELHTRLGRNYRLRWSDQKKRWCVEQKVARVYDYPGSSDQAIRLRDGYRLVLEMPEYPVITCKHCSFPVEMPVFEKAEFQCDYCKLRGVRHTYIDGYFPMVDKTLTYLERWNPKRGKALNDEIEAENAALRKSRQRAIANIAESLALDGWRGVAGIPSTLDIKRW